MTVRGWGSSCQTFRKAENSTAAASPTVPRWSETYPPEWEQPRGELVLGPGTKLQPGDPFVTLYYEFHRAVREAKVCVAIGCSFQDDHVREPLKQATQHGLTLINVGGPQAPLTALVHGPED